MKGVFDGRNFYWIEDNKIYVCEYERIVAGFNNSYSKVPRSTRVFKTFSSTQEAEEEFERIKKQIQGREKNEKARRN